MLEIKPQILADGGPILVSLSYKPQMCALVSSCVFVCISKVIKLCVQARICGEGGTKLNVGKLGAHSLVDLVGIKMKRNVSKLQRL